MLSQMHVCRYWPRWVLHVRVAKSPRLRQGSAYGSPSNPASTSSYTTSASSRQTCTVAHHNLRATSITAAPSYLRQAICTDPRHNIELYDYIAPEKKKSSSSTSTRSDINMHHPYSYVYLRPEILVKKK